jgi:hypothetical protein
LNAVQMKFFIQLMNVQLPHNYYKFVKLFTKTPMDYFPNLFESKGAQGDHEFTGVNTTVKKNISSGFTLR